MPRSAVSGRIAASGRIAKSGRVLETRSGNPLAYASQYGLKLWLRADLGITLGGTLRASGTSPPAVTITGTPSSQAALHIEIDSIAAGTGLGQATFKWSTNGGTSYEATGVATASSVVLGTTGITAAFPAGPYSSNNKWDATVSAWADQSGNGNHATQATAANQPVFSLTGFGGYAALNMLVGNSSLATPSVSLGTFTVILAMQGVSPNPGYAFDHDHGVEHNFIWTGNAPSSTVRSGATISSRVASVLWLRDNVRKTAGKTFNGRHVNHLLYINGLDANATTDSGAEPGTGPYVGPMYIANRENSDSAAVGLYREIIVFSSALPASAMLLLHNGIVARASGAI